MSDFQDSSVYLAIYLNRSQSPVFSTTLYAHGGKASIYDLRSIIENYMEAKQLVHMPRAVSVCRWTASIILWASL